MKTICLETNRLLLNESPDVNAVARLPNHPLIWKGQKQQYEAYHNKVVSSNDGTVPVEYFRNKYGRFYVCDTYSMSATPMWANARSAAFYNDVDIDGVQFHPNLLYAELEELEASDIPPPKYDALVAMCVDREGIFSKCNVSDDWLQKYNNATQSMYTKKDLLKNLATIVIFGGNRTTWESTWIPECPQGQDKDKWKQMWKLTQDDNYSLCNEFDAYIAQIPNLAKYMMQQEKYRDIVEWHRETKKQKGEAEPSPGGFLAIILQNIEADLLLKVMQTFHKKGLTPTVYAYDGFQIKKPNNEEDKLKLETALNEVNTFRKHATFVIKPFRPPVPNLHLYPARSTEFDVDVFNKIYKDAKTDKLKSTVYCRQKEYWEMTHFVLTKSGEIGEIEIVGHFKGVHFYTLNSASTVSFSNLRTYVKKKNDWINFKFFDTWMSDPYRRQHKSAELYPPGGKLCPNDVLNLWTGWRVENTPYDPNADFSLVLNHLNELIEDKAMREYYLNWLAHKVQFPGTKIGTCIVLYGLSGAGKSIIAESIFEAFLGSTHYYQTEKVDDITGKFADNTMNLVIVLNEASGRDNFANADALKNAITQNSQGVEKKSVQKVKSVNCLYDLMATTNGTQFAKLEGDADRRFVIAVCSSKFVKFNETGDSAFGSADVTTDYFDRLCAQLHDPSSMRAFFEFLKNRDLTDFKPRQFPSSKLREAMILSQESPEKVFMKEWLMRPDDQIEHKYISKQSIYRKYTHYYFEGGYKMEYKKDEGKFDAYIKMLDGIGTSRKSTGKESRGYKVIDWKKAAFSVGLSENDEPEYSNPQ